MLKSKSKYMYPKSARIILSSAIVNLFSSFIYFISFSTADPSVI